MTRPRAQPAVHSVALAAWLAFGPVCVSVEPPKGSSAPAPPRGAPAWPEMVPPGREGPWLAWRGRRLDGERIAFVAPAGEGLLLGLRAVRPDGTLLAPEAPPRLLFVPGPSPERGLPAGGEAWELWLRERGVPLELRVPATDAPAGVALVVHGPLGDDAAAPAARSLLERGVALVVVRAEPFPSFPVVLEVPSLVSVDEQAPRLARLFDERTADTARAALAGLERLAARHPDLPRDRVVLLADGLGAAPALAAAWRLGDAVRGAVFAGGAADLFSAAAAAGLRGVAFRPRAADWPPQRRRWFDDLYRAEAGLDPLVTARCLSGRPVLVVQARFDAVLGNAAAEALFSALGRPLRWLVLGGHDRALAAARDRADEIADFLSDALSAPAPARSAPR